MSDDMNPMSCLQLLWERLTTKEDVFRRLPNVRQNHIVLPESFPKGKVKHTRWYTWGHTGSRERHPARRNCHVLPASIPPLYRSLPSSPSSASTPAVPATLGAASPVCTSPHHRPGTCHQCLPRAPQSFPLPPVLLSFPFIPFTFSKSHLAPFQCLQVLLSGPKHQKPDRLIWRQVLLCLTERRQRAKDQHGDTSQDLRHSLSCWEAQWTAFPAAI